MKTTFILLGALLSLNVSIAQNCTICSEALKQGTKDEFFRETTHSLDESVNTLYSYDYEFWESYQSSSSHTSSLDAAYKVFSASFSSSSNSSEKKETFNKQKTTYLYARSLAQNDYEKISQSLVNRVPYDTFSNCVKNLCGNGLFIDYETTGDNIIVTVRWILTSGSPDQVTTLKTEPSIANATPINYNLQKGVTLKPNGSISALYRRIDSKEDAVLSYDFEYFTTQRIVVKRSKYENTEMPVGSVIASCLDYTSFCTINNIPLSTDSTTAIWVPADGRTVSGSIYAQRQPNVPDLRGTFLRGLNIFDPMNNPAYSHPEQKDPDSRSVKDIQTQDIQPHNHDITDPGHAHTASLAVVTVGDDGTVAYRPSGFGTETSLGVSTSKTGITIDNSKGKETRPTNIAVYYYVKIN